MAIVATTGGARAQDEDAQIRFVHGVSGVGALDLYVDGAAAIFGADFPSASDALVLTEGEHRLSLTPTGAGPDAALVEGSVETPAGATFLAAALGTADDVRLFLYEIDRSPLGDGEARLRVVPGAPDAGPVDVAVTGGDLLFPTVEYPDGTDYADVEAATYDLELRVAATDQVALALPQTALAAGQITDLFAVGQVADGSLQVLAVETSPDPSAADEAAAGGSVAVRGGDCGDLGEVLGELDGLAPPSGEEVGDGDGLGVATVAGTLAVAFDEIAGGGAVVVSAGDADAPPLACGPIAGALTEEGGLVVGLRDPDGDGVAGVALLAPGAADPATTDVAVYLVEGEGADGAVIAAAAGDGEAEVPDEAATPAAEAED